MIFIPRNRPYILKQTVSRGNIYRTNVPQHIPIYRTNVRSHRVPYNISTTPWHHTIPPKKILPHQRHVNVYVPSYSSAQWTAFRSVRPQRPRGVSPGFLRARPRFVARLAPSDSPGSRGPCPRAGPPSPRPSRNASEVPRSRLRSLPHAPQSQPCFFTTTSLLRSSDSPVVTLFFFVSFWLSTVMV